MAKRKREWSKEANELLKELILHRDIPFEDCEVTQAAGRHWLEYGYTGGFACIPLLPEQVKVLEAS